MEEAGYGFGSAADVHDEVAGSALFFEVFEDGFEEPSLQVGAIGFAPVLLPWIMLGYGGGARLIEQAGAWAGEGLANLFCTADPGPEAPHDAVQANP